MEKKMIDSIRSRAMLGLPILEEERAMFLLFIANDKEVAEFLKNEKKKED